MIAAFVMLLYLSSPSSSTGMTIATAEYSSLESCEKAGKKAKNDLGGIMTTVRYSCSPK